jgi:hypothetical protein
MSFLPSGLFVPTTQVWDTSTVPAGEELKGDELRELIIRLYQNLNVMALVINNKESALYGITNFITSAEYYPNPATVRQEFRSVVRTVVNFGPLPNATTTVVAHNIPFNDGFTLTRLYAAATDTTGLNYIPIPYASGVSTNSIELRLDATNVYIGTSSNRTNFTLCSVVIEYLMN